MRVTLSGTVMLARREQPKNTYSPMSVTVLGIVTVVRLVQFSNTPSGRLARLPESVTLVRLLQFSNAHAPMPAQPSARQARDLLTHTQNNFDVIEHQTATGGGARPLGLARLAAYCVVPGSSTSSLRP